jgi:hypothetical protein
MKYIFLVLSFLYKKFPVSKPKITDLMHRLEQPLFIIGKMRDAGNVIHYGDQILIAWN